MGWQIRFSVNGTYELVAVIRRSNDNTPNNVLVELIEFLGRQRPLTLFVQVTEHFDSFDYFRPRFLPLPFERKVLENPWEELSDVSTLPEGRPPDPL